MQKLESTQKRKYLNLNILVSTIIISGLHVVGLDNDSHTGFINNLTIIYKRCMSLVYKNIKKICKYEPKEICSSYINVIQAKILIKRPYWRQTKMVLFS